MRSRFISTLLWKRTLLFLAGDVALIALSLYFSFLIRFDGQIPSLWLSNLRNYLLIIFAIKLPIFYALGLYRMSWTHVSIKDLLSTFIAVSLSSSLLGTVFFLLRTEQFIGVWTFPRSILLLDYVLTLLLIGGFRLAKRVHSGWLSGFAGKGRRVLVVGAGDAGEQIVRAMLQEKRSLYSPVGFVDDDRAKHGTTIHGIPVLGGRKEIPSLAGKYDIEELLISIPSASSAVIRETVELGRRAKLRQIKILPGFHELVSGKVGLADFREVRPEDLLGREPVDIEVDQIESYLRDKVVMVTGAAGSIGAEICRQIDRFAPKALLALDQDETGLFYIENELREKFSGTELRVIIADIRDQTRIQEVFQTHRPQVVFHAAAYKHVPLMEAHTDEAVKNNVFGTLVVAEAAQKWGTEKLVLISTDKAVKPTSVMGATKRVAEKLIQTLNRHGKTKFLAVRFGNVLGSRGSVIPIFQEQIRRGGPVTVTHESMQRYFMAISEAVLLVLQAGAMGQGGEVFVLDMGDPIKIVDLARELIRLSGYEPDKDIPIVFTGQRPGEKFFEELLTAEEGTVATHHRQIFVARMGEAPEEARLRQQLGKLENLAAQGAKDEIRSLLQEIVPTYQPNNTSQKHPLS